MPNKAMRTFSERMDMTPKVMAAILMPVRMVTKIDVYFGRSPNNLIFCLPTREPIFIAKIGNDAAHDG